MVVLARRRTAVFVALLQILDHVDSFQSISKPWRTEGSRRLALLGWGWSDGHNTPQRAISSSLWSGSGDEYDSGNDATQTKRRPKKNKYNQFSKIKSDAIDPLDAMIAESKQKVEALQQEIQENNKSKWKRVKEELANGILQENNALLNGNSKNNSSINIIKNKMSFPDTKKINPYDPTTFGYIEIGHVTGAHGVHGWIKVESTTAFSQQRLCTSGIRHLKPPNKRAPRQVVLLQGKHRLHDEYLIQLQDVDDRNTATTLRGSVLYAREEDILNKAPLLSTSNSSDTSTSIIDNDDGNQNNIGEVEEEEKEGEEDEYFIADLVGLDVFLNDNPDGFVGKVGGVVLGEEMCSIPGIKLHDMLEIVLQKGPVPSFLRDELVLIPFVPDIVPRVNIPDACIFIQPPAGLLDLTYVRQEKVRIKAFLPPGK